MGICKECQVHQHKKCRGREQCHCQHKHERPWESKYVVPDPHAHLYGDVQRDEDAPRPAPPVVVEVQTVKVQTASNDG